MRIGFVTGEYPPMQGGIGAHCKVLSRALIDQGHSVSVFSDVRAAEDHPGINMTTTAYGWGLGTMRQIDAWARHEELDVVNMHYQTAAYQMSPWLHYLPEFVGAAPVVTTFHDLRFPYLFPKAGPLRPWIVRRLAGASAGVIATNHEDYAQLISHPQHTLIPLGSSVLTDLPADYNRTAWRSRLGADDDTLLIAHFGFINHSKGVDTLLDVLVQLKAWGTRFRLIMIGGRTGSSDPTNAAYADRIDTQIEALGLGDCIHWTGFLDDREASAVFASVDGVALPFRDGASYRRSSLMAVIHHGCAIVTTQPAVTIPAFIDGENMLLVPPENSAALAAVLQRLAGSSALRGHLRKGAQALQSHFTWDNIAAANVAFFQRVTGVGR